MLKIGKASRISWHCYSANHCHDLLTQVMQTPTPGDMQKRLPGVLRFR